MNLLIILGHRLNDDASMNYELVKRLNKALEIYKENNVDYIIVSGGSPNKKAGLTEASQMSAYLLKNAIGKEKLIIEDRSNTTYSNAWNIKKMLLGEQIEKIYLVSSKYHFERSYSNCYRIFKRNFKKAEIIKCMAD